MHSVLACLNARYTHRIVLRYKSYLGKKHADFIYSHIIYIYVATYKSIIDSDKRFCIKWRIDKM